MTNEEDRPDRDTLSDFVIGYITAALWSSNDESTPAGGEPLDANYYIDDIDTKTLVWMIKSCEKFQADNADNLAKYCETVVHNEGSAESYAGHDFWLTRNGHGAGFWDRDGIDDDLGEALSEAARKFGEFYLYVGNDKTIHGIM